MNQERYEVLARMCLNNWHYIKHKVLEFNQEINFFTGHSGSGKSTVIDALQLLLYANTDGRSFFNKAASDDSDRSLIEYLRGMTNIEENNRFSYLRNQNFSTTIVLQLDHSQTGESQCIGVVFDVETATNHVLRQFFWHKGPLLESFYRVDNRAMSIDELKRYLHQTMSKEDYFCSGTNERFRKILYDVYLGGLDSEKFPMLFKRAISFRMDMKIEEFVKEFICMEQDIHIEDMQTSVTEYGRMQKKIQDTAEEITFLNKIHDRYEKCLEHGRQKVKYDYFTQKLYLLETKKSMEDLLHKMKQNQVDLEQKWKQKEISEKQLAELEKANEELVKKIAATGFDECKQQLKSVTKLLRHLRKSQEKWDETAQALEKWADVETTSNGVLWSIDQFKDHEIDAEGITKLKESFEKIRKETSGEISELNGRLRDLTKLEKEYKEELVPLRSGKRSYPKELEKAREYLRKRLYEEAGQPVEVEILANLLDIQNEEWRNAIEGYLGNNKLALIVEPKYVRTAMEIYQELDKKKYFRVAVLDTENLEKQEIEVAQGTLAQEVTVQESYLRNYIDLTLGNVVKCHTIGELREQRIGITPDCVLYKGFRMQHMNPENYTRYAYIGEASLRKRMHQLEKSLAKLQEKMQPLLEEKEELEQVMALESLAMNAEEYIEWQKDMEEAERQEQEKKRLEKRLEEIQSQKVAEWEAEHRQKEAQITEKRNQIKQQDHEIWTRNNWIETNKRIHLQQEEEWNRQKNALQEDDSYEKELEEILVDEKYRNYENLRLRFEKCKMDEQEKEESEHIRLREEKMEYMRLYPNRPFSTEEKDQKQYQELLERLQCDDLESFKKAAAEQARTAVEHFKDDFMYKIRSAIREAMDRQDELNHIISSLDFGKDKYRFVISKNKGPDGRYYDMFMDDSLEVNPSQLSQELENQMDFFTMSHSHDYADMINDLIGIFIPPENATPKELEEAKRNMDKYSDYRTYLSFEMQQIIKGEETIHINLSKMIKKNSGGEGQNPQYVALLASFAQMYRISQSSKNRRNPTLRLVVLDEAFSKMDAEKVAGCIRLIRGLGFQAIICATNDKIQNYLENVDKTFVFANPDKKCISIQEFERRDFQTLTDEVFI